jgi:hypothetical protein
MCTILFTVAVAALQRWEEGSVGTAFPPSLGFSSFLMTFVVKERVAERVPYFDEEQGDVEARNSLLTREPLAMEPRSEPVTLLAQIRGFVCRPFGGTERGLQRNGNACTTPTNPPDNAAAPNHGPHNPSCDTNTPARDPTTSTHNLTTGNTLVQSPLPDPDVFTLADSLDGIDINDTGISHD